MTLATITSQMSDLLGGGLPLQRCLDLVRRQTRDRKWGDVLAAIGREVAAGRSLSEALAVHPVFPAFYVGVIRTAENDGALDRAFEELARHLAADDETRRRLQRALSYPLGVLGLSFLVCLFLATAVIPRFEGFFQELRQTLPWPTRFLLSLGAGVRAALPFVAGLLLLAAPFRRRLLATAFGAGPVRRVFLWAVMDAHAGRWARRMSALLRSGFAVPSALRAVRASMERSPLTPAFLLLEKAVAEGRSLSDGLHASNLPPFLADVAAAGEEAGALDVALERAASALERGAEARLSLGISLLEPALILVVAAAVGFVALSLMLPIFEMSGGVR